MGGGRLFFFFLDKVCMPKLLMSHTSGNDHDDLWTGGAEYSSLEDWEFSHSFGLEVIKNQVV